MFVVGYELSLLRIVVMHFRRGLSSVDFSKLLIPSPAEKITIKNLHLSTHNKRNIFINIGTLAMLAHTYKQTTC